MAANPEPARESADEETRRPRREPDDDVERDGLVAEPGDADEVG
jgi:hypothetical protein